MNKLISKCGAFIVGCLLLSATTVQAQIADFYSYEVTHEGRQDFKLGSPGVPIVLEGVVGKTVSLNVSVWVNNTTGVTINSFTVTYYNRWTYPNQHNPGVSVVDLGNSSITFGDIADGDYEIKTFSAGSFVPPAAGIYTFEVWEGRTKIGDYSIEVVDLEMGELTYAEMRTPGDGDMVNITQTVTLSASVGPQPMRPLMTVDYYVNGYKVNAEPVTYDAGGEFFEYIWEVPYIGELEVEARAQLASGAYLETAPIEIQTVGYGSPPIVNISAPAGDNWVVGSNAQFAVQATDSRALVQQIDFCVNGEVVESIADAYTVSPWTFDFKFPSTGRYDIWTIAHFSSGNRAISNILEYRLELGSAPFVSLISPVAGMQFLPGSKLPILASSWDPNSLVKELKYFVNDTLIETTARQSDGSFSPDPINFSYNFPFAGNYRIYVQATDESGVIAQSEVVQVVVKDLNANIPTVVMSHPLPVGGGDTVNDVSVGSGMFINAIAKDGNGTISRVNFYINSQLIGSSSNAYEDTYSVYFEPTTQGNYVMFAEAVDNDGNRMHSPPLLLNVFSLEAQLPKVEILPLADQYKELDAGSEITVTVKVEGGLVDVNQVNFYVDGVLVDSQNEADEGNENYFTESFIISEPGVHLLSARAIEIDPLGLPTDNWTVADPVGVRVKDVSVNRTFAQKVFLSILDVNPTQAQLDEVVYALDSGQKTQAQYVYELMESIPFENSLNALMARYLLTGEWPTRSVLVNDKQTATTALSQLVTFLLPTFQEKYWGNKRIPDGFSTNSEFNNFFKALFKNKYDQDPNGDQLNSGVMQMKIFNMADFVAEFIRDKDATPFGSGSISTILGIQNPPNSLLEDRAYAASLYCNLLKVKPTVEEVEALRSGSKLQQIQAIISDPRF